MAENGQAASLSAPTATQRRVNAKLGKVRTHEHERIYNLLEEKIGPVKQCNFGARGAKGGVRHEGEVVLSIREFELKGVQLSECGTFLEISRGSTGLQGYCRTCSKRYRKVRAEQNREKNKGNGHAEYIVRYGPTKLCSQCKESLPAGAFAISRGMECGLHNMCRSCQSSYSKSIGERWIRFRPDTGDAYVKDHPSCHDDHIFPIAFGGSDRLDNHQSITPLENLQKGSSVQWSTPQEIPPTLLSERWRPILAQCCEEQTTVSVLCDRLAQAIMNENIALSELDDAELRKVFVDYNTRWGRRHNVDRAVAKFRTIKL